MKKIIYLKCKIEVEIGDLIDLDGVNVRVTQELINDNPELFEVKEADPEYVKYNNEIYKVKEWTCRSYCILYRNDNIDETKLEPFKDLVKKVTKEEFDKQELLKKAKKRFPKGSKFRDCNKDACISSNNVFNVDELTWISKYGIGLAINDHFRYVYDHETKVWATKLEKLFTTEDGIDLYDGDEYWWVDVAANKYTLSSKRVCDNNTFKYYPNDSIVFSTKEAAKTYIDKNKEKTLEDYESALFMSENTGSSVQDSVNKDYNDFYRDFKIHKPKLYWHNILISIADDLNCEFKEKRYYCISKKNGRFISDEIDYHRNTFMDIEFSSMEICNKAIEIMGEKLRYLF